MPEENRIYSIDIMRGITLILMLLVNDFFMQGVPSWPGYNPEGLPGTGLANWLLPGFLFIVGLTIPFSINKRITEDQNTKSIARHIIKRSVSLLIIGILMINAARVNPEFTGIGINLWAIIMYVGIFLIWNKYPENKKNFFTVAGLRLAGIAILVVLIYKFRSGEFENNGSLITGWWGFPGIIGWGYLVAALIYLTVRESILNTVVAFLFFLALNILTNLDLLNSLNPLKSIFGVIIEGNIPLIVLSGLLATLILKKYSKSDLRIGLTIIIALALLSILAGFILSKWFIIQGTSGWGLICIGISAIIYSILYWIIDIRQQIRWTSFLKFAGENSLTTYLASYLLYYLIWITGLPLLFYKQSGSPLIVISGSLIWALLLIRLTELLVRYNIKLKL